MSEREAEVLIEEIELTPLAVKGELVSLDDDAVHVRPMPFVIRHGLFLLTVVIPVMLSSLYFFGIAANRYVSEAHFIVRSTSSSSGVGGMAALLENQGLSRATDETYAVDDFLVSRDIVALLDTKNDLRTILSRPEADFINRYPNFYTRDNKENLYRHYKSFVTATIDSATGISTLEVDAFRPGDAHTVAVAILKYAEDLINRLNARAFDDAEHYAQSIVDREETRIRDIETRLTAYRNTNGTVDPLKEALASFEVIGKMTTELVIMQAQLEQQAKVAPKDPNLPALRQRVDSYRQQIDLQRRSIVGGDKSLATKLAGFERLELERELSARALGLAMINLAKAREDAGQQHLYLQTIVDPNVADIPDYSRKIFYMMMILLFSFAVFVIARAIGSITMEHAA